MTVPPPDETLSTGPEGSPQVETGESAETAGGEGACPACGTELQPGSVLCVQCGFHVKLGKRISTEFC
jgi:hypothetical protein